MSESIRLAVSECTASRCALQHGLSRGASASDGALAGNVAKWQQSLLTGTVFRGPGESFSDVILWLAEDASP